MSRRTCTERGHEVQVRELLAGVERECADQLQGQPLYEPFFQLMCYPVPNTVKAELDRLIGAMARLGDLAPRLLERFLLCGVVAEQSVTNINMPRYYCEGAPCWG